MKNLINCRLSPVLNSTSAMEHARIFRTILPIFMAHKVKVLVGLIVLITLVMFGNPVGLARIFLYIVLLGVTAAVSYWLAAVRSPIDASPTFFLMIIIHLNLGFFYSFIFLILSSIVPTVIAGGEFGVTSILFSSAFVILTITSGLFIGLGIIPTGIIICFLLLVIGFFINKMAADEGGMFMTITHAAITLVYFFILGDLLMDVF